MDPTETLRWGQPLLAAIDALDPGAPAAVLIRHSKREPLRDMAVADGVPLTPAGEEAALEFGRRLPRSFTVRLWHSPIDRCRVTAARIAEGFTAGGGTVRNEGVLSILGGPYVIDMGGMLKLITELGARYARAWFDGQLPPSVMEPREQATRDNLAAAGKLLVEAAPGTLLLLVTHDWNVMLVRETVLGLTHEQVGWLDYLDGVILRRVGPDLHVAWREHRRRVSLAELLGSAPPSTPSAPTPAPPPPAAAPAQLRPRTPSPALPRRSPAA